MRIIIGNDKLARDDYITTFGLCLIGSVISLLFTIGFSINNTWSCYLGLGILIVAMSFLDTTKAILLMIMLIPNIRLIKIVNTDMALLSYCFIITEIKYIIKHRKFKFNIVLLLLSTSVLITIFVNGSYSFIVGFARFILPIIILFDYYANGDNFITRDNGPRLYVFGTVINIICGFLYYTLSNKQILIGRFFGVSIDPNYYAMNVCVSLAFVFLMLTYSEHKLFCVILDIFLLISGIISASRTFVGSLVWVLASAVFLSTSRKNSKKYIPILLLGAGLIILLWTEILPIISNAMYRIDTKGLDTQRFDAWMFFLNNWIHSIKSFLFGDGDKILLYGPYQIIQHNYYIESLTQIGLIGSAFLLVTFISLKSIIVPTGRAFVPGLAPIIILLTFYCFLNGLFTDTFTFALLVCILFYSFLKATNNNG